MRDSNIFSPRLWLAAAMTLSKSNPGGLGNICAGPHARRTSGQLVVVVEDIADLEPMLRAAERLVPAAEAETEGIKLLLVCDSEEKAVRMEDQVRLALGATELASIQRCVVAGGGEMALVEVLRRLRSGFVIGRFGGLLVPPSGDARRLTETLECPLFLMR